MPGGETSEESVENASLTADGCLPEAMAFPSRPSAFGGEQDGFWSLNNCNKPKRTLSSHKQTGGRQHPVSAMQKQRDKRFPLVQPCHSTRSSKHELWEVTPGLSLYVVGPGKRPV